MKYLLPILIILTTTLSCNNTESKKDLTEKDKQESLKEELSNSSEKIVLLSTIKQIPYDSLTLILTDYYSITSEYNDSSDSSKFYSEKAIKDISEKYHISKKRTASIIFSFKYEMLTKEETADQENEKREEEQQETPEDPY